jgi:Fe-S-cluster containining protein
VIGAEFVQIADAAFDAARVKSGAWLKCAPGCSSCCQQHLFPITAVDAARLREGLRAASPDVAAGIRERAHATWTRMQVDFPGDTRTGVLVSNEEWREWFFARHRGHPCPVLDPASGACLLHAYRPVACRLYGPLVRIGADLSEPCGLCYEGATRAEIEACGVTIATPSGASAGPETLIAHALATIE